MNNNYKKVKQGLSAGSWMSQVSKYNTLGLVWLMEWNNIQNSRNSKMYANIKEKQFTQYSHIENRESAIFKT